MSDTEKNDDLEADYATGQKHVAQIEAENNVVGYNVHNPKADYPYHPSVEINPAVHFGFAGNPELQVKWQEDLTALQDAKHKANEGEGHGEAFDKSLKELTLTNSSGVLVNEANILRAAVDADIRGEDAQEVLDNPGNVHVAQPEVTAKAEAERNQKSAEKRVESKPAAKKAAAKKTTPAKKAAPSRKFAK